MFGIPTSLTAQSSTLDRHATGAREKRNPGSLDSSPPNSQVGCCLGTQPDQVEYHRNKF